MWCVPCFLICLRYFSCRDFGSTSSPLVVMILYPFLPSRTAMDETRPGDDSSIRRLVGDGVHSELRFFSLLLVRLRPRSTRLRWRCSCTGLFTPKWGPKSGTL